MIAVYTNRMAHKSGPGRAVYDALLLAPQHGRCPLCGHRNVSTLDHHLPKTRFPALAVTPLNLVPACAECNKVKNATHPTCAEQVPLHPYFDDIDDDTWLSAHLTETAPPAVVFTVAPPAAWSPVLAARVRTQFVDLGLASLYASQAAQELAAIAHHLTRLFELGGATVVRDHLACEADSRRRAQANSWQTATYTALAASDWYCAGGYDVM